ncbi:hypothetical protein SAMN05660909_02102 [Chitinophaga terrae (ex Kim and Jung 2007)]|uniref:Uncharacterized protein n=1 Tax=Chitinophaga terrae (ex Kim and Jung 2007) TaxID=408074 RepID=A0A1H4BJ66_9BACT|nr:hypothetical protein [Chitinophaga terrae (ex Kim and Jung 2007)]GEP89594.1 hypothetical protein CTE07_12390 [Chitinophaga terrae (ex Kim and Jung 2007)]SEA48191.1 hypothetical protein SAMN05660909_02102 [Chitinophaga terrae (ex Kim and Jung 2007)]
MKNEMSPVTSVYFVTLLKAYLRGTKTRNEIIDELQQVAPLSVDQTSDVEVSRLLFQTASQLNKDFYQEIVAEVNHANDTAPTREGVIHQLQALLNNEISTTALYEWATWHNTPAADDEYVFFNDIAVDYFCTQLMPAVKGQLSVPQYEHILHIFQTTPPNGLRDKVALVLLPEQEKQRFLFYLGDYIQGHSTNEQLDVYLLHKFGMDHQSFPYMGELSAIMHAPAKLPALLRMAAMNPPY